MASTQSQLDVLARFLYIKPMGRCIPRRTLMRRRERFVYRIQSRGHSIARTHSTHQTVVRNHLTLGNSLSWFLIRTMSPDGSQLNGDGADQPEALVLQILRLTDELSKFSSFEPNPSLDEVLGSIAKLCHQTDVSSVVEDKVLSRMPVSQTQQAD